MFLEEKDDLEPDTDRVHMEMTYTRDAVVTITPGEEPEREEMTYTVEDVTPTTMRMTTTEKGGKTEVFEIKFQPDGRLQLHSTEFENGFVPAYIPDTLIFRRK